MLVLSRVGLHRSCGIADHELMAIDDELTVSWAHGVIEVVDRTLDQWVMRIEPIELPPGTGAVPPATVAVVRQLASQFPLLADACRHTDAIQVVFPPEIRAMLATGQAHLMKSAAGTLPTAVGVNGKILGQATVVAGAAGVGAAGAGAAAGVGASAAAAAATTLAAMWPVLLLAGVGAAAAWSSQQWMENAFAQMQRSLGRIEHRLRDDVDGVLDSADALVELLVANRGEERVPQQVRLELAVARQSVEAIYRSRHRYVTRFKHQLEQAQIDEERKSGKRTPWAGDVLKDISDGYRGVVDELVTYLKAMIARARIGACTASVLVADGDGAMALRLLDQIENEIRVDYWDLQNRLTALSRHEAESRWHAVPVLGDARKGQADHARELVSQLAEQMQAKIGPAIPERDESTTLAIPTDVLAVRRAPETR
jgi:hypothetical protein